MEPDPYPVGDDADHAGARGLAARRHRVRAHKITMISIFAGALMLAGLFTLVPGRIMHTVLFGP